MSKRIVIDPVTRIEGHAKISIFVDDAGNVSDAEFHVVEFRGFEKFCEGRPFGEMPGITQRICGICPVSHTLASAKAGDALMAVSIPPAADKLRRLMNLGQIIPEPRAEFLSSERAGLSAWLGYAPSATQCLRLDRGKQRTRPRRHPPASVRPEIIEILGDKKFIHSGLCRAGVRSALSKEGRDKIRGWLPEVFATMQVAFDLWKKTMETHQREIQIYGNFPSLFMGLVAEDGSWEHHGGKLRFTDSSGGIIADQIEVSRYAEFIGESVQNSSYLKSPYYLPLGFPDNIYRVGPLARLNICERMGVPKADARTEKFKSLGRGAVASSFLYHYARLIEILASLEFVERYMDDAELSSDYLCADAGINSLRGVGASEAPRHVVP